MSTSLLFSPSLLPSCHLSISSLSACLSLTSSLSSPTAPLLPVSLCAYPHTPLSTSSDPSLCPPPPPSHPPTCLPGSLSIPSRTRRPCSGSLRTPASSPRPWSWTVSASSGTTSQSSPPREVSGRCFLGWGLGGGGWGWSCTLSKALCLYTCVIS